MTAEAVKRYTINRVREDDGLVGIFADCADGEKFVHIDTAFVLASDYDALTTELSHFKNGTADLIATIASLRSELAKQDAAIARAEEALAHVVAMVGGCDCHLDYKDRGMTDPTCVYCNYEIEDAEEALAASKGTGK